MPDCDIDIEVGDASPVDVSVATATGVDVSVATATAIDVSVGEAVPIAIVVGDSISVSVGVSDNPINIVVGAANGVSVELMEVADVDEMLQTMEAFAARSRPVVRKLAVWSASINVPGTSNVEMPTGLVVYPLFRDSGFIDFLIGGAHANLNSHTLTFTLLIGPMGSLSTAVTYTTPAINAGGAAGSFQWEARFVVKSQGPSSQNVSGVFTWNDTAGKHSDPIIGRITTANFGNPANGDNGDVEVRLEVSMSGSGPTLNVRNGAYLLNAERSGS